jgi:NADH-quinone oxidoreductase subunit K
MIDLNGYLVFSISLYAIGLYCLATKRNMLRLVLGIELLINAANINFITLAAFAMPGFVDPLGNAFACISIGLGGAVSAVALGVVLLAYRHYRTLDVTELRRLRG